MKQLIELSQWDELPEYAKALIQAWKKRKYGTDDPRLSVGECIEFLIAATRNYHTDTSEGRFYNNMLINDESVIGWEGQELIDILWYEVMQAAKQTVVVAGTFNETPKP